MSPTIQSAIQQLSLQIGLKQIKHLHESQLTICNRVTPVAGDRLGSILLWKLFDFPAMGVTIPFVKLAIHVDDTARSDQCYEYPETVYEVEEHVRACLPRSV